MIQRGKSAMKRAGASAMTTLLIFFAVILFITAGMTIKNSAELQDILAQSVESQLISTCMAAGEIIDTGLFALYDSAAAAQGEGYQHTLARLRALKESAGAAYIYALKVQGGEHVFVFDTDEENEEVFIPYELSPVHEAAFAGRSAADIMNVEDEYGSFNTGAVPLYATGQQIAAAALGPGADEADIADYMARMGYGDAPILVGIVSVDIEDTYLSASIRAARLNAVILVAVLAVAMVVLLVLVRRLMDRLGELSQRLERQAHYDAVTGLPNRQYLMEYLAQVTEDGKKGSDFALFFVDLDNFKTVNDRAGHDAGDELLRHIGQYLEGAMQNSKAFRPSAGQLNVAARVGGDEFVQLVHGVATREEAARLAEQLLDGFRSQQFDRYIEKYGVGLSIGVALYPYHSSNYHVLIKYADTAMYHAKHGGKNQYRVYQDEMSQQDYEDKVIVRA